MISLLFFREKAILCPNAKVSGVKFFKYLPVKRNKISKWSPLNLKAFLSYLRMIFWIEITVFDVLLNYIIHVAYTPLIFKPKPDQAATSISSRHFPTLSPDTRLCTRISVFRVLKWLHVWRLTSSSHFSCLLYLDYASQGVTKKVLYHLHWQTGWFTVWVNGRQNLGLVNFIPESRLPFVQISSIHRKMATKAWTRYQWWLWRNGTRISVWNISTTKTGLPFQMFHSSREFSTENTR